MIGSVSSQLFAGIVSWAKLILVYCDVISGGLCEDWIREEDMIWKCNEELVNKRAVPKVKQNATRGEGYEAYDFQASLEWDSGNSSFIRIFFTCLVLITKSKTLNGLLEKLH